MGMGSRLQSCCPLGCLAMQFHQNLSICWLIDVGGRAECGVTRMAMLITSPSWQGRASPV